MRLVPPFVASRVLSVWRPFFGLKVWIHEMGRIEVRTKLVSRWAFEPILQPLLAKDGCLEGLDLHSRAKTWFQFIHRRPERTTPFDSEWSCSFDADRRGRWWMNWQRYRRLIEMKAVMTGCRVLARMTRVAGNDEVQL
jgi:hypothetical protein